VVTPVLTLALEDNAQPSTKIFVLEVNSPDVLVKVEIFADPDTARLVKVVLPVTDNTPDISTLVKVVLPVTDRLFAKEAEPLELISSKLIESRTIFPDTVKSPPIVRLLATERLVFE
jgi:hypothetical protein